VYGGEGRRGPLEFVPASHPARNRGGNKERRVQRLYHNAKLRGGEGVEELRRRDITGAAAPSSSKGDSVARV